MFSGLARDLAAFRRDFLAIVVPNRDNAQIGVYLKQAIPKKYTHLISNKDLHDWQGMLTVIQDELVVICNCFVFTDCHSLKAIHFAIMSRCHLTMTIIEK